MNIPSKLFGLDSKNKLFEFRCSGCGEIHRGSPSFSYDSPVVYRTIPEAERENRSRISDDLCVIDDEFYFIKATLDIPILGVAEPLNWGLWISQSKKSFDRYVESFEGDQSEYGSFGWLAVTIPGYLSDNKAEDITDLACDVIGQEAGRRPIIEIHECDHPLYRDHTDGISWDRAIELAQLVLHP